MCISLGTPVALMSSTCLAVRKSFLISNSGSKWVDLSPMFLVVFRSLNENARGASLVPVPAFVHCKQCLASLKDSYPLKVLSSSALPGGRVKQTILSSSPVASANSLYVNESLEECSIYIDRAHGPVGVGGCFTGQ